MVTLKYYSEQGWALKPAAVNKSINLGTTNAQRIDPAES